MPLMCDIPACDEEDFEYRARNDREFIRLIRDSVDLHEAKSALEEADEGGDSGWGDMLDIKLIRERPEVVREALRKRRDGFDLDVLLRVDLQRRELLKRFECEKAARKRGKGVMTRAEMKELEGELRFVESEFDRLMLEIPNVPHGSVPEG